MADKEMTDKEYEYLSECYDYCVQLQMDAEQAGVKRTWETIKETADNFELFLKDYGYTEGDFFRKLDKRLDAHFKLEKEKESK